MAQPRFAVFFIVLVAAIFLLSSGCLAAKEGGKNKTGNITISNFTAANATALEIMPRGSYANHVTDKVLQNPEVVGILVPASWRDIEKKDGEYDWSQLDSDISRASSAGKAVVLNLAAGGRNTPDWVLALPGVQTYTFLDLNQYHATMCQQITIPVFWDQAFLEKKKNFIQAAGHRYGSNPAVVGVMVSFANAASNDWSVPDSEESACGAQLHQAQDWLDKGYTTEKMFSTAKETIDAWATAFPSQALKLPLGPTNPLLDGTATNLTEMVVDYGYARYPDRFFIQMNGLSTRIPYANDSAVEDAVPGNRAYILKMIRDRAPQVGLQMLAGASNGDKDGCRQNGKSSPCPPLGVLTESVQIGLSYNPHFIEYWHVDAENDELRPALALADNGCAG